MATSLSGRLFDFWKGVGYGLAGGVFAFSVGFFWGKIVVCGYSVAWLTP